MNITRLVAVTFFVGCCAQASAQSVTVLRGSEDVQSCVLEARLASAELMGGSFNESACTRALAYPELNSTRDRAALLINRGIIFAAQQEYQAAFEDYKTALALKPDMPETYANLGNLYFLADNFNKAVELYDKSLDLGVGRTHVVYVNRGMALEKLGQQEQAQRSYEQALSVLPDWPLAQRKLSALRGQETHYQ